MRPVTKGLGLHYQDGQEHGKARVGLEGRLGFYCSYCERELKTGLQVEHILAKDNGGKDAWANFLLGCGNCNPRKGARDPGYAGWLIPDRDNTAAAFVYEKDGVISVRDLPTREKALAERTLELLGLNKKLTERLDDQSNAIPYDLRTQRLQAWLKAERYRAKWESAQTPQAEEAIVDLALTGGFFSIWMAAFAKFPAMRLRFIQAFQGTEAGCFDPVTTEPMSPHPNPDRLPAGGKL